MRDLFGAEAEGRGVFVAGLTVNCDQSMVRPSRRGGVPVLRRQPRRPSALSDSPSSTAAGSPLRPAGYCCSPQWIRPLRNVPVVMMTACGANGAAVAELDAAYASCRLSVVSSLSSLTADD